ncbi:MAG TPA: hypothetical protein VK249_06460 [Anaerolineales bacterium]|nr:hypothetical protein [Anaerolineales bacterium]
MNLGPIVEVAIGIIFVWITLSLATIQIQEWITTQLNKRARDMESAIQEMLANPDLKAQFYDHPVIRGLTANKRRKPSQIPAWFYRTPILRGFTKEKRKLPSYIPAQQFALTMFDIALTADTESSVIQQGILKIRDDLHSSRNLPVQSAIIEELNLLSELARSAAATEAGTAITNRTLAVLKDETEHFVENFGKKHPNLKLDNEVLRKIKEGLESTLQQSPKLKAAMDNVVSQQPPGDQPESALSKVRRGVAALSVISPEVHQALSTLLMNVEEYSSEKEKSLAKARGNVEKWFDDSMDRVSGVFKRYSQVMAFIIGFVVALVLNVDSINLTVYLWRDPSVRQVLAAQASQVQLLQPGTGNNPEQAIQQINEQLGQLNLPVGWGVNLVNGVASADDSCKPFPKEKQTFGIPLLASNKCLVPPQADSQTNILLKLVGIFITALAAMQGAPFWFDMLKRLVNLRGTGANPAEKEGK